MKKNKYFVVSGVVLATLIVVSGFTLNTNLCKPTNSCKKKTISKKEITKVQTANMFVSHGHCSLPFGGMVKNLKIDLGEKREDGGNPIENMKLFFEIDPNSFNACRGEEFTSRVKTPGLFINENDDKIVFKSTNVYTMGVDWYQVNGLLSIKGVAKEVKFFVSGIRNSKESSPSMLILEGQFNLFDWGIDYDKIVTGKSDKAATKTMHINMKVDLC